MHLWLTSWLWCVSKYWEIPRQRSNCGWASRAHTAAIQTTKCKEIFIWVIWTCKHAKLACITHIHTQLYAVCLAAAVDPGVSWTPSLRCTNACMCVRVHLSRAAICGQILPILAMKMKRLFIFTSDRRIFILPWTCCVRPCKKREQQCVCLCAQKVEMMCVTCSLPYQLSSAAQPSSCSLRGHWPRPHTHVASPTHMTWTHIPYWPTSFFARMEGALSICPYVCVFVCVFCWNRWNVPVCFIALKILPLDGCWRVGSLYQPIE